MQLNTTPIVTKYFISRICFAFICLLPFNKLFSQDLNYLFKAGDEGYSCFRIPAIITTTKGSLLAFAEARKKSCDDAGDIDLVMKRSEDGGKTWSKMTIVWNDGEHTCGNPAPVVDERTGNILLLSTWNLGTDHEWQIINGKSKDTRRIFSLVSTDNGNSWSSAKEITNEVKLPGWTWYATGPCNGIQMRSKKHPGRILIPCDHIEAESKKYYSHVIYSDDGGNHWKLGGTTPTDQVNECTIAELPRGKLLLNMRNYNAKRTRQTTVSKDGGLSWSALQNDAALIEPVCQASMIRYNYKGKKQCLAFSNPANQKQRVNMTVKLSFNKGKSWQKEFSVYSGPSAYSNLVVLPNGALACFFEAGIKSAYEGIAFKEVF
jgi:sialidase-1